MTIDDLLYYDDALVKAGVSIYGHEAYQTLISNRNRVITGTGWLTAIKNYKLLKQYLNHFNATYRTAISGMNNSIDHIPVKMADDVVEYDVIGSLMDGGDRMTETGNIIKRLQVNKLRVNEFMATEYIVSRISKVVNVLDRKIEDAKDKDRDPSSKRKTPKKADADIHFKYLKDHDLEDYYKSVYPKDKLRKVTREVDVPKISKFESSED